MTVMQSLPGAPVGSDRWWLELLLARRGGRPTRPNSRVAHVRSASFNRRDWLDMLWSIYQGNGPLPRLADEYSDATQDFLRLCRTDYASTIVTATATRTRLIGGVAGSDDADAAVRRFMLHNGSFWSDACEYAYVLGSSAIVVSPPLGDGPAVGEAVDPRDCAWSLDPKDQSIRAFLKVREDEDMQERSAHLFLPASEAGPERIVVFRQDYRGLGVGGWDLDSGESGDVPVEVQGMGVPVVLLENRFGQGEFERSLDTLDRISNGIADRLWAAKFQVWRLRGLENAPKTDPDTGAPIDYSEVLVADPASLSVLPPGATFWESGQLDLTPFLSSVKEDIRQLSTETDTPMSMFLPDVNQSAAGADASTQAAVSKAEDRIARFSPAAARMQRIALAFAGVGVDGVEPTWAPVRDVSDAERAQSASFLTGLGFSRETVARKVLGWGVEDIARMRADERRAAMSAPVAQPAVAAQPLTVMERQGVN